MQSLRPSPQAAARELLRRRAARQSLTEYARYIEVPGAPRGKTAADDADADQAYRPVETQLAAHHVLVLEATQRCIERANGRTMIFMPPGSAKTTYASIVAPTWAMGRWPGFKVIGVSYGSDLARKFGRRTRSIIKEHQYASLFGTSLSADSAAADEWSLDNGS